MLWLAGCAHLSLPSARTPGEHRFSSDGITLVYHVAGKGPVLIAHPGGPGVEWTYLSMPEVERDYTVVYLEPVGTGRSDRLPRGSHYRIDRYVRDLEALRIHLGSPRIFLLGHSHGGFVAQAYAVAHPAALAGLILYDTSPTSGPEWQKDVESNLAWFSKEPWFRDATAALAEESTARTDEQITSIFHREAPLYFAHYSTHRAELTPLVARMRLSIAPGLDANDPSASAEVGVAPAFEMRSELSRIKVPTLVIVGRRDFICSIKMAELLRSGIPGARLAVLEQSGHLGHLEEPEDFSRAVASMRR